MNCNYNKYDTKEKAELEFKKNYKKLIQRLYNSSEDLTNLEETITLSLIDDTLNITNVMGDDIYVKTYILTDKNGKNALVSIENSVHYGCPIGEFKILLGLENREFYKVNFPGIKLYITKNLNTGKKGIYSLNSKRFVAEEKYDEIEPIKVFPFDANYALKTEATRYSYIFNITLNEKVGRIDLGKWKKNIPLKYKKVYSPIIPEIDSYNLNGSPILEIVKVQNTNGKIGAYCYCVAFHTKYISDEDRGVNYRYIKKRFIEPIFNDVELYGYITNHKQLDILTDFENIKEVLLKVNINGKFGIISAFAKKLIVPPIFDKIEDAKPNDKYEYFYGTIAEDKYVIYNPQLLMTSTTPKIYKINELIAEPSIEEEIIIKSLKKKR